MQRLNLTEAIVDKLGFSEYWDENGTGGTRTLDFSTGDQFRIYEQDEMEDGSEGYGDNMYIANHYYFSDTFAIPRMRRHYHKDLFFLHNIYECIEEFYPNSLSEFTTKCEELGMAAYIKSFLNRRAALPGAARVKLSTMSLRNIPSVVKEMLALQSEVSELSERLMWLNRMDLPDYNEELASKVKQLFDRKQWELIKMVREYLG